MQSARSAQHAMITRTVVAWECRVWYRDASEVHLILPHPLVALQVMEEVSKFLQMMDEVYTVFGLQYKMALSTRPDDYMGELAQWDKAEAALTDALNASGKEWEVRGFVLFQPVCSISDQEVRDVGNMRCF